MASTELAIVDRMSATLNRVASWFSEGVEYIASTEIKTVARNYLKNSFLSS